MALENQKSLPNLFFEGFINMIFKITISRMPLYLTIAEGSSIFQIIEEPPIQTQSFNLRLKLGPREIFFWKPNHMPDRHVRCIVYDNFYNILILR